MFPSLPTKFDFPAAEAAVRQYWEARGVFDASLKLREGAPPFVFYEGPPTANGLPHPGHCLTRAMKDLFPRYQTMLGKRVERKAGWDTHGLPVEVEVSKELGIHTKAEIEAYGVEEFVRACIDSVFRYVREWEELTQRLGFWVNLDDAYVTFHQSYVESVWWGLKTLFDRGLLYQGHKVVWWWAQAGTALSSGEVGEGYREVMDPSVYVKFPLSATQAQGDERPAFLAQLESRGIAVGDVSLLVWTTTPWTLISNHFAAVHPDLDYTLLQDPETNDYLVVATGLVDAIGEKVKRALDPLAGCQGADLLGVRYVPPFDSYYASMKDTVATLKDGGSAPIGWRVTEADFVTLDSGTGLVHEAPAFGEVDYELLQDERQRFADRDAIPLICAVQPNGTYGDDAPEAYRGRWVKDCDKEISRELKQRGLLYHQEQYKHDYPFAPRAEDDALIQYARTSWFVRTSELRGEFLSNNAEIKWLPEHIQEGRFGDFLRNNVDWALSRERFWGTPLPIWECEETGKQEAVGSLDELRAKPGASDDGLWASKVEADPEIPVHLQVHKPYIDAWTYDSPFAAGAKMRRVSEVIDCWWDAGSMPFAQWGFPHEPGSIEKFAQLFPADFISEAIDQTRGWFYGLLAISTLLFGDDEARRASDVLKQLEAKLPKDFPHPYKTCIVLGLMLGEDGLKMSKRKKNYREPSYLFDEYGADALRWFLYSGQPPWTGIRFQEANVRDAHREFLVRLYNVFSFFTIYANIDGFAPDASPKSSAADRSELDRWILSELHRTVTSVRVSLDAFENYPATQRLNEFVDALSNWYVRRSRDRFWKGAKDQDKWDAYHTLYECLTVLSKTIAPFTPFFAEVMYQQLERGVGLHSPEAARQALSAASEAATSAGSNADVFSVHLCDFPEPDASLIDEELAEEMALVRQIVSLGRSARTSAKLKVRQPLQLAEIILARQEHAAWLESHAGLIAEELNIKEVAFTTDADHYVTYQVKANFKALGPKFGKQAPLIGKALATIDAAAARRALSEGQPLALTLADGTVELTADDVEIRLEAKEGWSAAQDRAGVVVVKTDLTPELLEEGLIRELIHHVQGLRRDQDLAYEARITLHVQSGAELRGAIERHRATLASECLVSNFALEEASDAAGASDFGGPAGDWAKVEVEGHPAKLAISVI